MQNKISKQFRGETLAFAYDVDPKLGGAEWDIVAEWCIANTAPGDTFIDIGANIGYISALVARFAQPRRIIIVEPDSKLHPLIEENMIANAPGVEYKIIAKVVMDQPGKTKFFLNQDNPAQNSIYARPEFEHVAMVSVFATTLDEIVAENEIVEPFVLKVDAEFAEPLIWRGMQKSVPLVKAMCMEFNKVKLLEVADTLAHTFGKELMAAFNVHDLNHNNIICLKK